MSDICSECGVDTLDVDFLSRELDQLRAEIKFLRLERQGSDAAYLAIALQVKALQQENQILIEQLREYENASSI